MIKRLSNSASYNSQRAKQIINVVSKYPHGRVLDVGAYNGITEDLEKICLNADNTKGDLDVDFEIPRNNYDMVLMSHIIEHIFNPLHALLRLKEVLKTNGKMIIALPQRPKFLWWRGHYHEIDHYRMQLLLKRAGLEIIKYEKYRVWRKPLFYISGIRPFLRLFLKTNSIYVCQKKGK